MKNQNPKWLETAVFYEIYPQTFKDTNGDGIGDFAGIMEKLPYIKQLGCNAIWLNPCFESPFSDAGYDVADYYKTAPRYGTNEDLKALFDKVHELGMHIILDLVPGHTSIQHPWFRESMKPEKNAYTDRYVWTNEFHVYPDGMGYLRGISQRDGTCAINFFTTQPALNYGYANITADWQQPTDAEGPQATLAEMMNIMRFWLNLGCDGFRVDMAGTLVKNDPEYRETIKLWQKVRAFLDAEFPEAVMVSEWGEPDMALEGGFNMDFLLHFGPSHYLELFHSKNCYFSGEGDVAPFVEKYRRLCDDVAGKGYICIPSGNHDMARLSCFVDEKRRKLVFAFLLSVAGVPFIYYGDEIGMRYLDGIRSVEGGYSRTGARSPMQWDHTKNAGFSTADTTYIPLDDRPDRPTVESQLADENSLYHEVKKLIAIRAENKALQNGADIEFVNAGYPLIYRRACPEQRVTVIINPSDKPCEATLPTGKCIYQIGSLQTDGERAVIAPCSAAFIETK